ncbi:MAG: hypothetical protein QOH88_2566 [Verrucomicrobiota bacterium]|jgi:hypothetical protein
MLRLTLLIGFSVLFAAQARARLPIVDHLVPWWEGFEIELRPLVEKKLLLTSANCGRMFRMYQLSDQGPIPESVVSVYCIEVSCHVTLTRASKSLSHLWADRRAKGDEVAAVRAVGVFRRDAVIPQSTAHAYRDCLRAALRATRKLSYDEIVLDNDRIEFWLIERGSSPLKAERPSNPGENVQRLIGLGDRLSRYCEMPEAERRAAAVQIEQEALRLQRVFARK